MISEICDFCMLLLLDFQAVVICQVWVKSHIVWNSWGWTTYKWENSWI